MARPSARSNTRPSGYDLMIIIYAVVGGICSPGVSTNGGGGVKIRTRRERAPWQKGARHHYPVVEVSSVPEPHGAMTRRLLCTLLLLCAAPLSAQQVGIPHRTFELPNGLRLIVHEDHSVPMAAVNVWYHVGSGYEEVGRTGFAHLFEHIMFEGSANVPEGDFDNLLEAAGASNNGSTDSDRTNYYEVLPSNAVDLALWLEADRMGGLLQTMGQTKLD